MAGRSRLVKSGETPTTISDDVLSGLSPYVTAWGPEGFLVPGDDSDLLSKPGTHCMVAIDLSIRDFNKYVAFEYVKVKHKAHVSKKTGKKLPELDIDGESWWEGGMQSQLVHTVRVVSDDGELLFVFYDALNNRSYPQWLGKLVADHPTTIALLTVMREYMLTWNEASPKLFKRN